MALEAVSILKNQAQGFRSARELPALVSYLRQRRCVLFVGAGLSLAAGYPGWRDLMLTIVRETASRLKLGSRKKELLALVRKSKFAEVADQCRTLLGRSTFSEILRASLAREADPPADTHRAIVRTPYACIVTTNFDTLLEDAYAKWSDIGVPKAPTGAELAQHGTLLLDGAFFILKAHGTIHEDASMVFTSEDYRRITHANPAFQSMMSAILLSHAVLFVGYSLNDPNFRLLLDSQLTTFGSEAPPRYALMENVGEAEKQILRRTTGIEVISFPKGAFGEVAGLLQYLDDAAAPAIPRAGANTTPKAAAPRRVLRPRKAHDAFVLSLRARDAMVDGTWYRTDTSDLAGVNVPLERKYVASAVTPPWERFPALVKQVVDAFDSVDGYERIVQFGTLLMRSIPGVEDAIVALPQATPVILDVAPELSPLPWEWIAVEGTPLMLRVPVSRTVPGFHDASRGRPLVREPLRVLLIGDTLAEASQHLSLPGARAEVEELRRLFLSASPQNEVTLLIGARASYARVLQEIENGAYDVVHFAGHAWFDASGTFLFMHDGRVVASELVTLLIKRPPALLMLSSHYTGFPPVFSKPFPLQVQAGAAFSDLYQTLRSHSPGLEWAAARAGVGTFIGCMGSPGDDQARTLAVTMYRELLNGETAAAALFRARQANAAEHDVTRLLFSMAGYSDLRLVRRHQPAGRKPTRPHRQPLPLVAERRRVTT